MTWLYLALFAPGLVGAGYILGWTVRGRKVDAGLLAASERAEQVLRDRYIGQGISMGVAIERRTGELFRGKTTHIEDIVQSVPEYVERLRNLGGL